MGEQSTNPAQPLFDLYNKWTGNDKKPAPPPQKPDTSWHDDQVRKANEAFANKDAQQRQAAQPSKQSAPPKAPSYKKGGMVRKTGLAKLHAGEKVIPKKDVKRTEKAVKKYSGKK